MNKPILLTLLIVVVALFGFKQYDQGAAKETIAIVAKGNIISISGSNIPFRERNLKKEGAKSVESKDDFTSVLKLVNEYQSNGWQIRSSNLAIGTDFIGDQGFETHTLYFMLEK